MFKGPRALTRFDALVADNPRFRRPWPYSWQDGAYYAWEVLIPFVNNSSLSSAMQQIGTVSKFGEGPHARWDARVELAQEDIGCWPGADRNAWIARKSDLYGKLAPTKKDGFHTRQEAARWVIDRSLQVGVLLHRRNKYLTPLQQLAECAEEDS